MHGHFSKILGGGRAGPGPPGPPRIDAPVGSGGSVNLYIEGRPKLF